MTVDGEDAAFLMEFVVVQEARVGNRIFDVNRRPEACATGFRGLHGWKWGRSSTCQFGKRAGVVEDRLFKHRLARANLRERSQKPRGADRRGNPPMQLSGYRF